MSELLAHKPLIEAAFADRAKLQDPAHANAVQAVLEGLDAGKLRVAEKLDGAWVTHAWVKQAILLYFGLAQMQVQEVGPFEFHDKIPLKKNLAAANVRVVPPGT